MLKKAMTSAYYGDVITLYHQDNISLFMDFTKQSKTIRIDEKFNDYYRGICPFCGGKNYKIIDTWNRDIQESGTPNRKIIVNLEVKRILCLNPECNIEFTPGHPMYPKNHRFSRDIIEQCLNLAHKFNKSAVEIALELKLNNSVEVHPKTVQSWINNYSEDYFNKRSVDCWSGREINGINIPWFIEETENFSKWNQYTRCAHIWRILNEMGLKFAGDNADKVMQSRLEDVTTNPEKFVDSAERFLERKKTDITKKNLESIKTYQQMEYPNNTLHIEGSEKERYIKFMETLGYSMTK